MNFKKISFYLVLYFLAGIFVFLGCEKKTKKQENIYPYPGTATAIKNGDSWSAKCIAFYHLQKDNEVNIHIDRYNSIGIKSESFSFRRIPLKTGSHPVVRPETDSTGQTTNLYTSRYFSLVGSDAINGEFHVLESDSNYIEITQIDLDLEKIVGKFDITYVKDTTFDLNADLPDTLRFEEGNFQTKIQEGW